MGKKRQASDHAKPLHVTSWDAMWVEAGAFYITLRSGQETHVLSMGPNLALQAIELTKRALVGGQIVPLEKTPGAH